MRIVTRLRLFGMGDTMGQAVAVGNVSKVLDHRVA
jgi:hypothetical protein